MSYCFAYVKWQFSLLRWRLKKSIFKYYNPNPTLKEKAHHAYVNPHPIVLHMFSEEANVYRYGPYTFIYPKYKFYKNSRN